MIHHTILLGGNLYIGINNFTYLGSSYTKRTKKVSSSNKKYVVILLLPNDDYTDLILLLFAGDNVMYVMYCTSLPKIPKMRSFIIQHKNGILTVCLIPLHSVLPEHLICSII